MSNIYTYKPLVGVEGKKLRKFYVQTLPNVGNQGFACLFTYKPVRVDGRKITYTPLMITPLMINYSYRPNQITGHKPPTSQLVVCIFVHRRIRGCTHREGCPIRVVVLASPVLFAPPPISTGCASLAIGIVEFAIGFDIYIMCFAGYWYRY